MTSDLNIDGQISDAVNRATVGANILIVVHKTSPDIVKGLIADDARRKGHQYQATYCKITLYSGSVMVVEAGYRLTGYRFSDIIYFDDAEWWQNLPQYLDKTQQD